MYLLRPFVALFAGLGGFSPLPAADEAAATRRVRSHTTFLADDALEGRAAASRGYELAANYVAAQFARVGLQPGAAGDSFRQPVSLVEISSKRDRSRLVVRHEETEDVFAPFNDMLVAPAAGRTMAEITAPAVYVGYGVHAPELGHDDFAGVDVRGKVVVLLGLAPLSFPGEQYAHYTSGTEKFSTLARLGAVGVVIIAPPRQAAQRPWAVSAGNATRPAMRVLDAAGGIVDDNPGIEATATLNPAAAQRLFVAAPITAQEAFAASERNEVRSFPLNVTITLGGEATIKPSACANVLGWLPGTDPALAGEPVVVTGHLDHLGLVLNQTAGGDKVFNGAMDNAIGIGVLLAMAEELAAGPGLRRPVLFAALTAEEKGLLGAKHLALQPPPQVTRYAANLNFDMPLFTAPVRDVIAWGAEHSTLGAAAQAAANRTGMTLSPDFMPEERVFVRSDQYAFVRRGVPALFLGTGKKGLDPEVDLAARWQDYLKNRYHKRNDDLTQSIDWASAGAYAVFAAELVREIAQSPEAPRWHAGNFFGGRFAPAVNAAAAGASTL